MKRIIDAIYEKGIFRPIESDEIAISEGKRVRITVEDEAGPEVLKLATAVYENLSEKEIGEIERIALDRSKFFRLRSVD